VLSLAVFFNPIIILLLVFYSSPFAYKILVGRPEGRRPLGRPRRRWQDNITMDLQDVGWGAWTGLIWLRIGRDGGLLCVR
jgi:hypothetical protein